MAGKRNYTDITNIKSGQGAELVHNLYEGRTTVGHPRNVEPRPRRRPPDNSRVGDECPKLSRNEPGNTNANQFPEQAFGPHYSNDVDINSWLRDGDATGKPGFDFGGSWRKDMRSQIKDHEVDHNRHHSEFGADTNSGHVHATEFHSESKRRVPAYERHGELSGVHSDSNPKPRSDSRFPEATGHIDRHGTTDSRPIFGNRHNFKPASRG